MTDERKVSGNLVLQLRHHCRRHHSDDCQEQRSAAADTIDALRAERDALREALERIRMAKFEPGTWQCVAKNQKEIARAALKGET